MKWRSLSRTLNLSLESDLCMYIGMVVIFVLLRSFSCAALFIAQLLFGGFVDSKKKSVCCPGKKDPEGAEIRE